MLASTAGSLSAATDHYYVNDHLATTVAVTDAAGELAAIEADAFGSPVTGANQTARYTGKPYDNDLGAYVFPCRNYRSDEARWMSADPSGFPDGVNSNAYTPSVFTQIDPLGLNRQLMLNNLFHAFIRVDLYDTSGNVTGQRDLHFAPYAYTSDKNSDFQSNTPSQTSGWSIGIKNVVSTAKEDQVLLNTWDTLSKDPDAPHWNPIANCWIGSLAALKAGIVGNEE